MRTTTRRVVSWVAAMALLLTCAISGLVLPVAATTPSFTLQDVTIGTAAGGGSYSVYKQLVALDAEGNPYEGEIAAWVSSDPTVATVSDGLVQSLGKEGTTTITAMNADGETATCTVTVSAAGERITGGDFEYESEWNNGNWNKIIKDGVGAVVTETDGNHALAISYNTQNTYYTDAPVDSNTIYKLSFDVKGGVNSKLFYAYGTKGVTILDSNVSGYTANGWQDISNTADEWREVWYIVKIGTIAADSDRGWMFQWQNNDTNEGATLYLDNVSLVELPEATGISLPETAEMVVGTPTTLELTTTPADAFAEGVEWTSSNEEVATVANGTVTPKSKGETVITATCGELTASCTVTVQPSFRLLQKEFHLGSRMGDWPTRAAPVAVTHDGKPFTGTLTWTSSNTSVVSVNSSTGLIATVNPGATGLDSTTVKTATVTATNTATGETDTCEITVSRYHGELIVGGDFDHNYVLYDPAQNSSKYRWSYILKAATITNDPNDATNKVLELTAKPGTAPDSYYYYGMPYNTNSYFKLSFDAKGFDGTAKFFYRWSAFMTVETDNITGASNANNAWHTMTIKKDEWTHAEYILKSKSEHKPSYNFALLNQDSEGRPVYLDNISFVEIPLAEAIALPETLEMTAGDVVDVPLTTTPAGAYVQGLTFTSSDTTVATVDAATGEITALKDGEVVITATSSTGLETSCTVTVNKLMATDIVLNPSELTLVLGGDATLTVEAQPSAGYFGDVTWTSSDETVVTVVNGTVTAVGHGTATVTAVSGDLYATCFVTVSDEVITGGTFEEDDTAGTGTFGTVTTSSTVWYIAAGQGFGGGNALAINYLKTSDARWFNWPSFAPNTTYTITFMAKGPAVQLKLLWFDGSAGGWTSSSAGTNLVTTTDYQNDWTQYRIEFTVGEDGFGEAAANYRGFHFNRADTLSDTTAVTYIDNFSIKVTDPSGDRIVGGDFEVPGPQQLNEEVFAAGYDVVADGETNKALFIPAAEEKGEAYYLKALNLKQGKEYIVSFKSKGDAVNLYLNPKYLTGTTGWQSIKASDDYTTHVFNFTASADATSGNLNGFTVGFGRDTELGTTGTYIDDLSIVEANTDIVADEVVIIGDNGNVKPGHKLTFTAKVTNNGDTPIDTGFPVEFRVNGNVFSTVTYEGTIEPGATVVVVADEEWTAEAGNWIVSVKVNGDLSVADAQHNNNTAARELYVADTELEVPAYAQLAGFDTLTFSDEFDSISTIDLGATGEKGYKWYVRRPYGASTVTSSDIVVENGVLTLKLQNPTYNYGLGTIDTKTGNGFVFNKGYMEIKFRIPDPSVNGEDESGVPAIWSLPPEKLFGNSEAWVEMDWMEYWGKGTQYANYPDGFYTVSMHDHKLDGNGEVEYQYKNSNYKQNGLGDQGWHTMGWTWKEGSITTYLDGNQVMTQAYSADSKGSPAATLVKGTAQNGVFTAMNTQMMALILGGSADSPLEVDYVRIWQDVDDDAVELLADPYTVGGEVTLGADKNVLIDAAADEVVSVTAKPAEGYVMKPGSLKYVKGDGTEVAILNENLANPFEFNGGDGYTFQFEAPGESVKVTAEFVKASYAVNTIGTGLREVGVDSYDGIRFLTRIHLATTFKPDEVGQKGLFVTIDGAEYEVVEFGSLLHRAGNGDVDFSNYKWQAIAYKKGGNMNLVDYTDSYIDFTVVMKKGQKVSPESFKTRQYTARGYIKLQKVGSDTVDTILCDNQLTNSVESALESAAL